MKIFKDSFTKDIEYNRYFNGQVVCFLDIETTGFSREYNMIYLIGLVFYHLEKDMWEMRQIFADDYRSEKEVLLQLIEFVKDFDLIVTYNGDSFDLPFINSRLKIYDIDFDLFSIKNFDIYKMIRNNKHILEFENYRLKTVEKKLNIFRDDIYSGGECIQFYKDYIKTKDMTLLDRCLNHNYDDLFYLVDIIKIKDMIEEKRSIHISNGKIMLDNMIVLGDVFKIDGHFYSRDNIKIMDYDNLYNIEINHNGFKLELNYDIGLVAPDEKGLFIDKSKFALEEITSLNANYKIPDRFILLQVNKRLFVENIKRISSTLINRSIKNLM